MVNTIGVDMELAVLDSVDGVPDDTLEGEHYNPTVRLVEVPRQASGTSGFHLTRSKWDPYPWISRVDSGSMADSAGVRTGDCVLEVNGEDVLGLRVASVAELVRSNSQRVDLLLWSTGLSTKCNPEALCCGPMPSSLNRLSASMSAILSALECPICFETIPPPALQCVNGHLVCGRCRERTDKCPVCREKYGRGRSLLADQVFNSLTDAFELRENSEDFTPGKLREKLFGPRKLKKTQDKLATPSHTNKFLARIMGKSSSVENLSSNEMDSKKTLSVSAEDFSTLKTKSVSTSEIFRPQSPIAIPRCPSAHRLERSLGEGLTTKRPLSRYNSTESLLNRDNQSVMSDGDEIILHVPIINMKEKDSMMNCPCNENCDNIIRSGELLDHISSEHPGPLIQWGSSAEFSVPPLGPMEHACLALKCYTKQFYLKLEFQKGFKDNSSNILIWCWVQGSNTIADQYLLDITLTDNNGKKICARSAVYSLQETTWQDIKTSRRGIFFTAETLLANFGCYKSLNLRAEIILGSPTFECDI